MKQYFFDSGSSVAREDEEVAERSIPHLAFDADATERSIPVLDWRNGESVLGHPTLDSVEPAEDLFGMQVAGDALGKMMRGGIALVE